MHIRRDLYDQMVEMAIDLQEEIVTITRMSTIESSIRILFGIILGLVAVTNDLEDASPQSKGNL